MFRLLSGQESGALKWEKPIGQKALQKSPVMSSRPSPLGSQHLYAETSKQNFRNPSSPAMTSQTSPQRQLPPYQGPLQSTAQDMESRLRRFFALWGVDDKADQVPGLISQVCEGPVPAISLFHKGS